MAGLRRLRGGDALFDLSQNPVAARFGSEVDHLEAVRAQRAKLLMGFAQHIERTAVGRDPAAGGEELKNPVEDGEKVGSFDDQRVAVREEHLADRIGDLAGGFLEVGEHLGDRADPERLVLIHGAEGAAVAGAADGELKDEAVRLAGGTVYVAFVNHGAAPFGSDVGKAAAGSVPALRRALPARFNACGPARRGFPAPRGILPRCGGRALPLPPQAATRWRCPRGGGPAPPPRQARGSGP